MGIFILKAGSDIIVNEKGEVNPEYIETIKNLSVRLGEEHKLLLVMSGAMKIGLNLPEYKHIDENNRPEIYSSLDQLIFNDGLKSMKSQFTEQLGVDILFSEYNEKNIGQIAQDIKETKILGTNGTRTEDDYNDNDELTTNIKKRLENVISVLYITESEGIIKGFGTKNAEPVTILTENIFEELKNNGEFKSVSTGGLGGAEAKARTALDAAKNNKELTLVAIGGLRHVDTMAAKILKQEIEYPQHDYTTVIASS